MQRILEEGQAGLLTLCGHGLPDTHRDGAPFPAGIGGRSVERVQHFAGGAVAAGKQQPRPHQVKVTVKRMSACLGSFWQPSVLLRPMIRWTELLPLPWQQRELGDWSAIPDALSN